MLILTKFPFRLGYSPMKYRGNPNPARIDAPSVFKAVSVFKPLYLKRRRLSELSFAYAFLQFVEVDGSVE